MESGTESENNFAERRRLECVASVTGWRLGTWSSGRPCLRKPCGRVASEHEVAAIERTIARRDRELEG